MEIYLVTFFSFFYVLFYILREVVLRPEDGSSMVIMGFLCCFLLFALALNIFIEGVDFKTGTSEVSVFNATTNTTTSALTDSYSNVKNVYTDGFGFILLCLFLVEILGVLGVRGRWGA